MCELCGRRLVARSSDWQKIWRDRPVGSKFSGIQAEGRLRQLDLPIGKEGTAPLSAKTIHLPVQLSSGTRDLRPRPRAAQGHCAGRHRAGAPSLRPRGAMPGAFDFGLAKAGGVRNPPASQPRIRPRAADEWGLVPPQGDSAQKRCPLQKHRDPRPLGRRGAAEEGAGLKIR